MLKDEFRELLSKRVEVHPNDAYETEKYWKLETALLARNIKETIEFLDNECTSDEFSWISEVFEDIAEATQSLDFIECLKRVAAKFPEECKKYNIVGSIEIAENHIGGGR